MAFGINEKIKVVWLCHFRNKEILGILNVNLGRSEYCPWITLLIKLFEPLSDQIELHIISPCEYLSKDKSFNINTINYYFINIGIPFWGRHWPAFFKIDFWTNFILNRYKIARLVNTIKPDIIHLHGLELPDYATSVFNLMNNYPVFATIQGFISNSTKTQYYQVKRRIYFEQCLLKELKHFGIRANFMGDYIKKFNPKALMYWHNYPINSPEFFKIEKEYDCVYFARISKDKGIEDLLKAIHIIKKKKNDISLIIIGACNVAYKKHLDILSQKLDIFGNLTWKGFLTSQAEVYKMAAAAKISVLPTYHDIIPGTVIESMLLKIPVISYNVGGLPDINFGSERIKLIEKGNIAELANVIEYLLDNETIRNAISEKAYTYAKETYNNSLITSQLINIYREVILS